MAFPRRILVLATLLLVTAHPLWSQQPGKPAGGLARVPPDAAGFLHVRVADVWKAEMFAGLKDILLKAGEPALAAFDKRFQPAPSGVESITLYLMPADEDHPPTPGLIVSFSKDFKPADALKALLPNGASLTEFGQKFTADREKNLAAKAIDSRTLLLATALHMPQLMRREIREDGPMATHLRSAAGKPLYAALDVTSVPRDWFECWPEEAQPVAAAKEVVLTGDVGKVLTLSARAKYADAGAASAADKAARAGLETVRARLTDSLKEVEKKVLTAPKGGTDGLAEMPEAFHSLFRLAILRLLEEQLARPPLKASGDSLTLEYKCDINNPQTVAYTTGLIAGFVVPATEHLRGAATTAKAQDNLKQLALAMHAYENANGFMPSAIRSEDGKKVLLSWRVAMLPHLGQDELYKQFKKDEAWDSDHNKKLISRMPAVFIDPDQTNTSKENNQTHYQLITGGGAGFRLDHTPTKMIDVVDGTSNTLMIVTATDPVAWTKPEDVVYDPIKSLPRLGLPGKPIQVAFFDGSVRGLAPTVSQRTLRALISRAGGELIGDDY